MTPPTSRERVVIQEWPSEELAFEGEKMLIAYYGRIDQETGCLRNLTDGGEGIVGKSEEQRRKIGEAQRGKRVSEETRRKQSEAARRRPHLRASEETRRKISEARLGMKFSKEHRRHIGDAQRGKKKGPYSEERCRVMSEAKCYQSEETRRKIGEANSKRLHGRPWSAARRAAQSTS